MMLLSRYCGWHKTWIIRLMSTAKLFRYEVGRGEGWRKDRFNLQPRNHVLSWGVLICRM